MAPTIKTIGEYKTHQDYFVDFFGDNLLVTQTGHTLRHQAMDPRRRLPSPSLAFFSPSRRWSRRPVDTVMVLLTTGVRPSSGYTPAMRGNISSHRPALLLSARPQHPSTFPHESRHDFCRFLEQPRRVLRGRSFEGIVEECIGLEGVKLDRKISRVIGVLTTSAKSNKPNAGRHTDAYSDRTRGVRDAKVLPKMHLKFDSHSKPRVLPQTLDDGSEMSSSSPSFHALVTRLIVGGRVTGTTLVFLAPPCHYPSLDTLQLCVGTSCLSSISLTVIKRVPDIHPCVKKFSNLQLMSISC
ncbi:hypothetical protein HID58_095191 [Brassica napus]|uniref:Uncharacterized protein n=1 Tax=Brassica napus TaxID=3708 RepID=A0ABQ7X4J5_BRANA|nr:hypothetical protein HID58_095191 [Brassica napus]